MNEIQLTFLILNTLAIMLAPIVAIQISKCIQKKELKRKDKLDIFKTLLVYNVYGWGSNYSSVNALNALPIIFADDNEVTDIYNKYLNACKNGITQDIDVYTTKLLEKISASLGYKSEWEIFKNQYLPVGLLDEMQKEKKYKDGQLEAVDLIGIYKANLTNQTKQQAGEDSK